MFLKKVWESSSGAFKPAIASTPHCQIYYGLGSDSTRLTTLSLPVTPVQLLSVAALSSMNFIYSDLVSKCKLGKVRLETPIHTVAIDKTPLAKNVFKFVSEEFLLKVTDMVDRPPIKVVSGMPTLGPFAENWENVQCFQARDGDLLIVTYPKSGTTWMSEILDLMQHNGDVTKTQRGAIYERVPFLEYAVPNMPTGTEILNVMESPRIIKTHLPVHLLPRSFWEKNCKGRAKYACAGAVAEDQKRTSWKEDRRRRSGPETPIRPDQQRDRPWIIYMARNPKDVLVSYYHFYYVWPLCTQIRGLLKNTYTRSWKGKINIILIGFGPWSDHVKGWWKIRHQKDILYLFYEDMLEVEDIVINSSNP
ncbi:unnamed protein product [Ranitomeya imitator]|uniref:Sulfotransferase n=1 Tax=Ranitomeya imitator TaxID=111125 RepID=A0ABN9M4N1_9NEOB|nr:unnamed protein product [Ranitomeya imitator]